MSAGHRNTTTEVKETIQREKPVLKNEWTGHSKGDDHVAMYLLPGSSQEAGTEDPTPPSISSKEGRVSA